MPRTCGSPCHQDTARALGVTRSKINRRLRKADAWGISAHGEIQATAARCLETGGKVRRYLLTSAQSNTGIHVGFWGNLRALADHYAVEIMVARKDQQECDQDRSGKFGQIERFGGQRRGCRW